MGPLKLAGNLGAPSVIALVGVWREPLVPLRIPLIYNLRSENSFERGSEDGSRYYDSWMQAPPIH